MNNTTHWNTIYASQLPSQVGWYEPHLETSLAWIDELALDPHDPIIDVGGGASTLVDDLLARGQRNITVVDLSEAAIRIARDRLGEASGAVTWRVGDVTGIELPQRHYRLWHDRAAFHFLIEPESQQEYKAALLGAVEPGGYFLIGTFSPAAPPRCSGLPVKRYDAELLASTFGDNLELKLHKNEMHTTPGGAKQSYVYCLFRKTG